MGKKIFLKCNSFNQNNWFSLNADKSIIHTQLKTKGFLGKIYYCTYSKAINLRNMYETFEPQMGKLLKNIEAA